MHSVISGHGLVHPAENTEELIHGLSFPEIFEGKNCCDAAAILSDLFPRPSLRGLPAYVRIALLAAVRALKDAGWWPCPETIPIVIGTAYSCQKTSFDFMDSILDFGPKLASPLAFSHAVNNMAAGLLCLMLKSKGTCTTVNNGQLSFAGALQTALILLDSGKADTVLVGAVDEYDPRFSALFPHKKLVPSSAFFCLQKGETGLAVNVDWHDAVGANAFFELEGRKVVACSASAENSMFQALACASVCDGNYLNALIEQTASEYGIAATIYLERR